MFSWFQVILDMLIEVVWLSAYENPAREFNIFHFQQNESASAHYKRENLNYTDAGLETLLNTADSAV